MIKIEKLAGDSGKAKLNLMCFHWAGGTGLAYRSLAKSLEHANICTHAVTLPGRNGRGTDNMYRKFSDLVPAVVAAMEIYCEANIPRDLPLMLFGHSFGGLLVYELIKTVEESDVLSSWAPSKAIISAVRNPGNLTVQNRNPTSVRHHLQTDHDLMDYIKSIGGTISYK
jgi:medium-chain acyl-[acyl-carrier-protein] hydrolase